MPLVFKALSSITVWILFITGCLVLISALPIPFFNNGWNWQRLAVGVASFFLSAVTMKIRKTLE